MNRVIEIHWLSERVAEEVGTGEFSGGERSSRANSLIHVGRDVLGEVWKMPHYIVLGNYTDQGARGVKDSIKRDEEARRMIERWRKAPALLHHG